MIIGGEHLDHSCLTGLTSALYIDESKGLNPHHAAAAAAVLDNSSPDLDPDSGLYIKNRQNDKIIKINIPHDCLAFQSGSTLQQVSKINLKLYLILLKVVTTIKVNLLLEILWQFSFNQI